MREDIENNRHEYEWLFSRLGDLESKRQLTNILNFRLSLDTRYMRGFSAIEHLQYFEEFLLPWGHDEVFADVGAFDGKTTVEFTRRVPDYFGVHVFEPISANMQLVRRRLTGHRGIQFHAVALGDRAGFASFNVGGSSSCQDDLGSESVMVERLDNLIDGRLTFLKIDIEGGEGAAIAGARETILREHPRLAIAAYHGRSDLWKIARQVYRIRSDYRIFLRHYTEGIYETDLFFLPDRR